MKARHWLTLASLVLCFSICRGVDRITDLHTLIVIEPDGALTITDSLSFYCDGTRLRELVYRRWPSYQRTREGEHLPLDLTILRISRDGADEPFVLSHPQGNALLEMGQSGAILARGIHIYSIVYRTTPQIDHEEDFDELTWRLDVGDWNLLIDRATVIVQLPRLDDVPPSIVDASGKNAVTDENVFSVHRDPGGVVTFSSLKPIPITQPFVVAVSFEEGYVERGSVFQLTASFIGSNKWLVVDFVGILLLLGYYLYAWNKVGIDPPKATVIPRFEPPDNLTPAAMRYIMNKGYDNKIFAVTIMEMALKGYLTVGRAGEDFVFTKIQTNVAQLTPLETLVAFNLFESDTTIEINRGTMSRVLDVIDLLKGWFKREYSSRTFFTNITYFIPGAIFTLVLLMFSHLLLMDSQSVVWTTFLLGWGIIVGTLIDRGFNRWGSGEIKRVGSAVNMSMLATSVFVLVFFFSIMMTLVLQSGVHYPGLFAAVSTGFICTNLIFYHLLQAPTEEGRRLLDEIEGFRLFLATAEKDQLKMQASTLKVPKSLEKYLPYAIALDVLQGWTDTLANRLTQLEHSQES